MSTNNRDLRVINWSKVNLYKSSVESGRTYFTPVYDMREKAAVIANYRDTREMRPGYSFFPLIIVMDHNNYDREASVIHAMSLIWYRYNPDKRNFDRVLDPRSVMTLSARAMEGLDIPEGFSTFNYMIDYAGIEDRAKPFNPVRVKLG